MANKVVDFLSTHGFKIMLAGFGISAVGLVLYIKYQFEDPVIAQYAFGVTIAGFCMYVFGRVFVFINRRNQKKSTVITSKTKDPV